MPRGHQHPDKKPIAVKNRRTATDKASMEQPWGGQTPIITGAIGNVRYGDVVSPKMNELQRRMLHNRPASKTEKTKRAA